MLIEQITLRMSASFCCTETGKDIHAQLLVSELTKEKLGQIFNLYPQTVQVVDVETFRWVHLDDYETEHSYQVYGLVVPSRHGLIAGRVINVVTFGRKGVPYYEGAIRSTFYTLAEQRFQKLRDHNINAAKQTVDWTEWRFPEWRPYLSRSGKLLL